MIFMNKIAVVGHFGKRGSFVNGQTIKTKIVSEEIKNQIGVNAVIEIDTSNGAKGVFQILKSIYKCLQDCKYIIIMPNQNGLRIIAPYLYFMNKLFRRTICYVVVGGWLPQFIENKIFLKRILRKYNNIFVETKGMNDALDLLKFNNVSVLPNCKNLQIHYHSQYNLDSDNPLRLCTFSRVMQEKGIGRTIDIVSRINEKHNKVIFSLDIYGQIDSRQETWFDNLRNSFPKYIKYKGIVDYDRTSEVLSSYFALVFLTTYEGEGFPGTIIDAMAAGVPTIASDWKYNKEIISNGRDGYVINVDEAEAFFESVLRNPNMINSMRDNCCSAAKKYQANNVIKLLIEEIGYNS